MEEQGNERMRLDEACVLSQSTRAASKGRSENEWCRIGWTSGHGVGGEGWVVRIGSEVRLLA